MEQVKILAIGNSFSRDATHYLHQIAEAGGINTKVVNIYIGGCSLERHYRNLVQDANEYLYEIDGSCTEQYISIKEALQEEAWDFVVTQQASPDSGILDTYYPYIIKLYDYVKKYSPNAEMLLHQTWAYEIDSTHKGFEQYNYSQLEMYNKLCKAYNHVSDDLSLRLIPCGDVVQKVRAKQPFLYEKGGISLCRDGFHMNYIYGRYLLASTWYEIIFGKSILGNPYTPVTIFAPGETADPQALKVIKECVDQVVLKS